MPLLLLLCGLLAPAHASDRADTLAERAGDLYDKRKVEPARKAATRSLAIRENEAALAVLVLVQLEDVQKPFHASSDAAAQAEASRRADVLLATMQRLEALDPNAVALGIARTVLTVNSEGDLLAVVDPECPPEANARFAAAEAAFGRHDLDAALKAYDDALTTCPKQSTWWVYSGDALHGQGNLRGAVARYEHALELDPCHPVAHRFIADTLMGVPDLNQTDFDKLAAHALDAVVCNPHYDAGWGTLAAVAKGTSKGTDLRLRDPQGYELLVSRTTAGEGDALDRRVAAARAVLAEGPPDTLLWNILAIADKGDLLTAAIAFETLDAQIADAYRARRVELKDKLRAWVVLTRVETGKK